MEPQKASVVSTWFILSKFSLQNRDTPSGSQWCWGLHYSPGIALTDKSNVIQDHASFLDWMMQKFRVASEWATLKGHFSC